MAILGKGCGYCANWMGVVYLKVMARGIEWMKALNCYTQVKN